MAIYEWEGEHDFVPIWKNEKMSLLTSDLLIFNY